MGGKNGGKEGSKAAGKNKQKALKIYRLRILKTVVTLWAQAALGNCNTSGVRASSFKQHTFRDVFTRPALSLAFGHYSSYRLKGNDHEKKKKKVDFFISTVTAICALQIARQVITR